MPDSDQSKPLKIPPVAPIMPVLIEVSMGKLSITQAARELDLPDAGYVLACLRESNLPLPRLSEHEVRRQADAVKEALLGCLIKPPMEAHEEVQHEQKDIERRS